MNTSLSGRESHDPSISQEIAEKKCTYLNRGSHSCHLPTDTLHIYSPIILLGPAMESHKSVGTAFLADMPEISSIPSLSATPIPFLCSVGGSDLCSHSQSAVLVSAPYPICHGTLCPNFDLPQNHTY